jgi:hypothetical protein
MLYLDASVRESTEAMCFSFCYQNAGGKVTLKGRAAIHLLHFSPSEIVLLLVPLQELELGPGPWALLPVRRVLPFLSRGKSSRKLSEV